MIVLRILVGVALLLIGRKLFWLFVAAIGFLVTMDLVVRLFPGSVTLTAVLAGLAAGVIGALLAVFLQQAAVGVAGFLAGGYIILSLMEAFGLGEMTILAWVFAIAGGIAGLILALALLDWALVVLSSLSGAALIVQSVNLGRPLTVLAFLVVMAVGIVVQARMLRKEKD
ncbi:MAG: hypothetical protein AB8I69_15695 [Anaerolineae bacterium]